jgi:uncharacterized membrane protein YphA (DoxX/SURF4 family)
MILGGTFLLSGLLKLRDPDGFTSAVDDYRVLPQRLVRPVALVVPFLELTLGTALLIGWWVRPAAFLSTLLLLSFAVAVGVNLKRERAVACHCFPEFGEDQIGKSTLVRQGVLIGCALAPLSAGDGNLLALRQVTASEAASLAGASVGAIVLLASLGVMGAVWSEWRALARTRRTTWASYAGAVGVAGLATGAHNVTVAQASPVVAWSEGLQWAVLVLLLLLMVGMFSLIADLRRRLGPDRGPPMPDEGLELGVLAPAFEATEARSGRRVRLSDYAGERVLMAFVSPDCSSCMKLVPKLNRLAGQRSAPPMVVVVAPGEGVDYGARLSRKIQLVHDPKRTMQDRYAVRWKPTVYLIDAERKIASRTISNTLPDLEDTVDGVAHRLSSDAMIPIEGGGDGH